jgi:hypothetical protein
MRVALVDPYVVDVGRPFHLLGTSCVGPKGLGPANGEFRAWCRPRQATLSGTFSLPHLGD